VGLTRFRHFDERFQINNKPSYFVKDSVHCVLEFPTRFNVQGLKRKRPANGRNSNNKVWDDRYVCTEVSLTSTRPSYTRIARPQPKNFNFVHYVLTFSLRFSDEKFQKKKTKPHIVPIVSETVLFATRSFYLPSVSVFYCVSDFFEKGF